MDFNVIIIGAGVVGLGVAKALSEKKIDICVLEKNNTFGQETSSRNSEVIHSGIYYPKNSLKSKLSKQGNSLLYEYCNRKKINFEKCGKLIIGLSQDDLIKLKDLQENAKLIGIKTNLLTRSQLNAVEPLVSANFALQVESTGIIDSHSFMNCITNDLKQSNIDIVFKTEVVNIEKIQDGYNLNICNPDGSFANVSSDIVINCTGLYSSNIASMVGLNNPSYKLQFWKGSYFWVNNKLTKSIKHLIYPIPCKDLNGLGIHTTKSIDGRVRFGPDAEYLGEVFNNDYAVEANKKEEFYSSIKTYLPFIEKEDLNIDFSGVRPKLQRPGESFKDFIIQNEKQNGFNNFINLIGIESPGLTSSLSIGEYVKEKINWGIL